MMIRNKLRLAAAILFILCVSFSLAACGGAMGDESTPDITLEYLKNDYSQQLLNDGAEKILGSVEVNQNPAGDIEMILHPKELVEDSSQESGWRVDSFALNRTFTVPEQAYTTYLADGETGDPEILSSGSFYTAVSKEYETAGVSFDEYGDHILYDVYALDNQVLLVLYRTTLF